MYVAVIGSGNATDEEDALAESVGAALARAGAVLVCGGLGGVMAAACRGAKAEGGTTLGILPGPDRRAANPDVDFVVATGIGEARNSIVVQTADAVIAVGGEFGTLSEIAFALRAGKPVVGLGTWGLTRPDRPERPDGSKGSGSKGSGSEASGSEGSGSDAGILRATSPEEAVETAIRLVRSR
jgi:uncharacterized protein (TIGR00725 family)